MKNAIVLMLTGLIMVSCSAIPSNDIITEGATSSTATQPPTQDAIVPAPADKQPLESPSPLPPTDNALDIIGMTPSSSIPPGLEALVEKAKEDLAQRLSLSITEIILVEATNVVWPDASLGCPQPGMLYKQVPEDGALIVLQAEGLKYEYHTGGNRGLFLCEKIYKDPNPVPKIDLNTLTPPTPDNSIPPGVNP